MIFIAHRINTHAQLENLPQKYGAEIDVRADNGQLILAHEPFQTGEYLEPFLEQYQHQTLILNIKCEGIEYKILKLLNKYNITNYFFLDNSFPMIVKLVNQDIPNIALRFSEYESIETIKQLQGKIKWIWVDCFTKLPLTIHEMLFLKEWGYQICIVSPDLVGRSTEIKQYAETINIKGLSVNAICTKFENISLWEKELNTR